MEAGFVDPLLVWGTFPRLVGLTFVVSFLSLRNQVLPLAGSHGVAPISHRLDRIRRDFSPWRRVVYFPALLWASSNDRFLKTLVWLGVAGGLLAMVGGPLTPWALGLCYVAYLSLDRPIKLIYPWDCVLFEAGFIALFLPAPEALPQLVASELPAPAIAWFYRLLLFRVMLGFGKFKFLGSNADDWAYLKGFLIYQPLPSPVAWYAQKLPLWVLKLGLFCLFLVEIPMAFLFLVPNEWSMVAAVGTVGLMAIIWLNGTFGYFNLVMIVVCMTVFDIHTPAQLDVASFYEYPITTSVIALHTLGAFLNFPLNTFCAHTWLHWPVFLRLRPRILAAPIAFYRLLHPLRWLHSYGVFPPKTTPAVKFITLVEASWDGETWHEYRYRISPGHPEQPPKFAAPHHPRGDQAIIYETFGLNDTSLASGIVGAGDPYDYSTVSGLSRLAQRLMEGYRYGGVFLDDDKVVRSDPPQYVRAQTYMLEPTSLAELRESGHWWKRTYVGPHMPPRTLDPHFWDHPVPPPELWHWEAVIWQRRSRLSEMMRRARRGDGSPEALLAGTDELSAREVEGFWERLWPRLDGDWERLPQLVQQVRERFDRDELYAFHRVAGRLNVMLRARTEHLFFGRGFDPPLPVKSAMHFAMLADHIILQGREAVDAVMHDPERAIEHARALDVSSGLFLAAVFRYDNMVFEAQKLRLIRAFTTPTNRPEPTGAEARLSAWAMGIIEQVFGFVDVIPFLLDHLQGEAFERGSPERYPRFRLEPSGEVVHDPEASEDEDAAAQAGLSPG